MNIYKDNDKNNCCGCGVCANVCPRDAITMESDQYGFRYPIIQQDKCIKCGLCAQTCLKANTREINMPIKAFAGSHVNKNILMKSSSGGVFSALAEHFIKNGGAVCGCIFDKNLKAIHICTESEAEFLKIRKSKYLQSFTGMIYRDVKKRLNDGQQVLFTGTPCQVAALYAFLNKNYDNLTTMDLVCHGVPSQLMFDCFIEYLEKKYKTKITNFDFRSKKYGWQRFSLEFSDSYKKTRNIGKTKEFYLPSFTGGDIIRPSCLSCKYACPERIGDITIGDLWGHEKFRLKCDIRNGTSLFTINSPKANKWLDILSESLTYEEIDYSIAVKKNTCLHQATPKGKNRDFYFDAFKNREIEKIVTKYKKDNKKNIFLERIRLIIPTRMFIIIRKLRYGR